MYLNILKKILPLIPKEIIVTYILDYATEFASKTKTLKDDKFVDRLKDMFIILGWYKERNNGVDATIW